MTGRPHCPHMVRAEGRLIVNLTAEQFGVSHEAIRAPSGRGRAARLARQCAAWRLLQTGRFTDRFIAAELGFGAGTRARDAAEAYAAHRASGVEWTPDD